MTNSLNSLSLSSLDSFRAQTEGDRTYTLARNAVTTNGILKAAWNSDAVARYHDTYSVDLKPTKVTDQKQTGRCWLFAAHNIIRKEFIDVFNLENLELSAAYGMFYDKLEKSNLFLEAMIALADRPLDDRELHLLLDMPIPDGGHFAMAASLIKKYGVVPSNIMPETASSTNSRELNDVLGLALRRGGLTLRQAAQRGETPSALQALKDQTLADIYRILCISLGEPPCHFTFEVRDKDDKFIRKSNITPQEFYALANIDLDDYIGLVNIPKESHPFNTVFELSPWIGNIVGEPIRFLNVELDTFVDATTAQLKGGKPIWFACDVGKHFRREQGLLSLETSDYEQLFGVKLALDKSTELSLREQVPNHAMTLQGVNLDDDGKPLAWKVENSWGDKTGKDGYLIITHDWFEHYTTEVIIKRAYLPQELIDLYDQSTPRVVPMWDILA